MQGKYMLFYLFVALTTLVTCQEPDVVIVHQYDPTTTATPEDCESSFQGFEGFYLQGVKEDFFITYNQTSFEDCMQLCCTEQKFVCQSFSYFGALEICYVMNITQYTHSSRPQPGQTWRHYQKYEFVPPENTTMIPEPTTVEETTQEMPTTATSEMSTSMSSTASSMLTDSLTQSTLGVESNTPHQYAETTTISTTETTTTTTTTEEVTTTTLPQQGSFAKLAQSTTLSPLCSKDCKNEGRCELVEKEENGLGFLQETCVCPDTFSGEYCEQNIQLAGIPTYIIIVIALVAVIFLLFLSVIIIYVIYRKKTGKYRVKEENHKWVKKQSQHARRAQSFNSTLDRPSPRSESSMPGSVTSTGTRSTATSV